MQYIAGSEILEEIAVMGAYNEDAARHIFKQVLEGIAYLHKSGVCHRDIKPSNILITKSKEVYLADFNVAKARPETDDFDTAFTMFTRGAGTQAFAAPERLL